MTWMEFALGLVTAILGGTGIKSLLGWRADRKLGEVTAPNVAEAADSEAADVEVAKLKNRVEQFWEMFTELREEVAQQRKDIDRLTGERDDAVGLVEAARAETLIVHSHVVELREKFPPPVPVWPADYPPHLHNRPKET